MKVIDGIRETIAKSLNGNPRQAKRFLNSFVMKRQLAELYYPGEINAAVLAKILALYQISPDAFKELHKWNCQFDGTIPNLKEALDITTAESMNSDSIWKSDTIQKWSRCPPVDIELYPLDHYFYLTRENLQSDDTRSDLTLEAKNVLAALKKATGGTIDRVYDDINLLAFNGLRDRAEIPANAPLTVELLLSLLAQLFLGDKSGHDHQLLSMA